MLLTLEEAAALLERPEAGIMATVAEGKLPVYVMARGWRGNAIPVPEKGRPRHWDIGTTASLPGGVERRAATCTLTGEKFEVETFRASRAWRLHDGDAFRLATAPSHAVEVEFLLPVDGKRIHTDSPQWAPWPAFVFSVDGGQGQTVAWQDALFMRANIEAVLHDEAGSAEAEEPAGSETMSMPLDWIEQARTIALEYIIRHKEKDLHPGQKDVCDHAERICRERKIYGPHGKPLSSAYIQRNAIQGEWWQRNYR